MTHTQLLRNSESKNDTPTPRILNLDNNKLVLFAYVRNIRYSYVHRGTICMQYMQLSLAIIKNGG